ncbi:MAG TPA: pyridoxal phosphate-dependent aminotransferase [Acidimicrobiia bacterium]|nr:pyridoxal phosphate-dependent aminotransferase [Acidimicrobiia bacterium]
MTSHLSARMAAMAEAGTVISVHRSSGPRSGDVINLSSGDPALPTPPAIVEAAQKRLGEGNLKYTDVHGSPQLRDAIREKFETENGLAYADDQIAVSAGSKQVMVNALLATLDPGDEVVIPAPYFAPYPRMVALAGGVPRVVQAAATNGFKLTPSQILEAIGTRTKWIIINSPSNPAGAIYTGDELASISSAVLAAHPHVRFMSDEVYEHYCYDGHSASSIARQSPEVFERTLTVNGVSKTFSMTGWRIGYAAGPAELVAAMRTIQHSTTTCPPELSQVAATAALGLDRSVVDRRNAHAAALLNLAAGELDEIPELQYTRPAGSIYLYIDCKRLLGRVTPDGDPMVADADLSAFLRDQFGVLLLPGGYYGTSPYLRLTFVIDEGDLTEGLKRLRAGVEALTSPGDR